MCDFCENKKREITVMGSEITDCGAFGLFQTDLEIDCIENKLIASTFAKSGGCDFDVAEVNINFCPLCGRKLSEETEKPNTDEIIAKLKENLTEDERKNLNESIKEFSNGLSGLWKVLRMDNCHMNLGAVKAKEIDGELYVSCWNFSKALAEKEREISDLCKENDELKKTISELESELAVKEDLLKTVAKRYDNLLLDSLRVTRIDEDINCGEEPLPFSSDEYEEDRIDKLEKRITEIEKTLDEQRKAELKSLKTETDFLKSRMAQSGFLAEILGY